MGNIFFMSNIGFNFILLMGFISCRNILKINVLSCTYPLFIKIPSFYAKRTLEIYEKFEKPISLKLF